ncbi:MAG: hypothetical protein HY094_10610 [Candidatus Melainabacteria bacterium]|nr:hypothetical protein [Candidatus Melainabacteria bacterium]
MISPANNNPDPSKGSPVAGGTVSKNNDSGIRVNSSVNKEVNNQNPPARKKRTENQEKILNALEKFFVTPVSYATAGLGVLSFLKTNLFKNDNEFLDKVATYASKAAVYAVSIFSSLNRAWDKDSFGTLAFTTDFVTTAIASEEDLYQWKGFGSGLDHSPLILGEVFSNEKIKNKFGEQSKEQFMTHKGFRDSAWKMLYASNVIIGDVINEFKTNGLGKAFMNCFINGERNAEKNLLLSGIGIIGGAFMSTIMGFKKIGSTMRDLFGVYADLAYIAKGKSEVSDGKKRNDKVHKYYLRSGIEYTVGSLLDLIFRWTGVKNLDLLALGINRLGARDGALGILEENKTEEVEEVSDQKEQVQQKPELAIQGI